MYALAYLRVSTDRQTIENQRINIERWARDHDYAFPAKRGWFEDEATHGWVPPMERPGFVEMIDRIAELKGTPEAVDNVLMYEVSRLGRTFWESLRTLEPLEETCPVVSTSPKEAFLQIADKGIRKLLLGVVVWAAEAERENLVERTKAGLERARAEGRHIGNCPLGYTRHSCGKLGHERCEKSGRLELDGLGRDAFELLRDNPKLRPVIFRKMHPELTYGQAWQLVRSVRRFGTGRERVPDGSGKRPID